MPVGPAKRFDELMICGKPSRRAADGLGAAWERAGRSMHSGQRRCPRSDRRHVAVSPVQPPEAERVLGLHHLGLIENAGFEQVRYRNLTGGIAAIHSGWRL